MKDGVVQQIATPQEVYAQPANLHVARFMGYRNVMELPVAAERDGHVVLRAGDGELRGVRKLPLDGARAMVAIRPEEITLAGSRDDDNVMTGRVDNVEYGGRDSLVEIVTRDGTRLHVRAPGRFEPGAQVFVRVPPERVLVYPREVH
jgi:putative spermidine/putrescine transport system ATP-binding protein